MVILEIDLQICDQCMILRYRHVSVNVLFLSHLRFAAALIVSTIWLYSPLMDSVALCRFLCFVFPLHYFSLLPDTSKASLLWDRYFYEPRSAIVRNLHHLLVLFHYLLSWCINNHCLHVDDGFYEAPGTLLSSYSSYLFTAHFWILARYGTTANLRVYCWNFLSSV